MGRGPSNRKKKQQGNSNLPHSRIQKVQRVSYLLAALKRTSEEAQSTLWKENATVKKKERRLHNRSEGRYLLGKIPRGGRYKQSKLRSPTRSNRQKDGKKPVPEHTQGTLKGPTLLRSRTQRHAIRERRKHAFNNTPKS